jgi:succinate dehydrogenase / fumarate reductase flavoprotein subunit
MARPKKTDQGEVISADLLIVGGGIAGLIAAIKAKEESPDTEVLLVDKQSIGWGGKANKGACVLMTLGPHQDIDQFMEHHVRRIGYYLNDQDLFYSFASRTYGVMEQLDQWGVTVFKDAEGKIDLNEVFSGYSMAAVDADMMLLLRARAKKLRTKMMDKTQVVELLKDGDRVTGAVAFDLIDGHFTVFKAKAIILANANCQFKGMRMWDGCGDGVAAAYWAEAEMRNAEFGNFYDILVKATNGALPNAHHFLYNAKGEHISLKYVDDEVPDITLSVILGMEKEILEGNGPLFVDMLALMQHMGPIMAKWNRPHCAAFFGRQIEKEMKYGPPFSPKLEVTVGFIAELAPVKVDHQMRTTLPGLWTIGDASKAGANWTGAVPPPSGLRGSGLMNAALSAFSAVPPALRYVADAAPPKVDASEVKRLKENLMAPMRRDKGYGADELKRAIHEAVAPVKYNARRSKERLEEALSKVQEVQAKLPELFAKDGHGLHKCHEVRAMAICAEMSFRAALARTESRGWHFREDYPYRDDKNWLKWITLKQVDGKMVVGTEPVPIDQYKFKPLSTEPVPVDQNTFKPVVRDAVALEKSYKRPAQREALKTGREGTGKVEKKHLPTDVVVESELPGVTPEMLDWWWVNMEKGYPLWEPDDHGSFVWEVPPGPDTHIGAIQQVEEKLHDGPVMKIRIRWDDPDTCPVPTEYDHVLVAAGIIPPEDKVLGYVVHEYEATPYGTKLRSTSRIMMPLPPQAGINWGLHSKSEASHFPKFLPDLYRLWQSVKNPAINRQASMKRKK